MAGIVKKVLVISRQRDGKRHFKYFRRFGVAGLIHPVSVQATRFPYRANHHGPARHSIHANQLENFSKAGAVLVGVALARWALDLKSIVS